MARAVAALHSRTEVPGPAKAPGPRWVKKGLETLQATRRP